MTHNALHTVTTILTIGSHSLGQLGNFITIFTDVSVNVP